MPARFTIRRTKPVTEPDTLPWKLRDATRPAAILRFRTLDLALLAMENRARKDLGLPPLIAISADEIRAAMRAKR